MPQATDKTTRLPKHHPDSALLMEYASGSLREPVALLIATHLALCPQCRAESHRLETVGGALLEEATPTSMSRKSVV